MSKVYIALIHHPIYNKRQDIVTTCITGFDLHDIARTALTYGVEKYYVVNPLPAQQKFAQRILDFWMDDGSLEFNWTRAEAFRLIAIKADLDEVIAEITKEEGQAPVIVATSAKARGNKKFENLRLEIRDSNAPYLLLFGTGWGLADSVFDKVDVVLEPIVGKSDYNHLSVRSANAIILDRLLSRK
ncbi:MAG: RNA methyltransferase [Candidatus Saganbacteria bacterium]|nr:RNA methyltransferase [Candidatus Saganbacteria bacterium]